MKRLKDKIYMILMLFVIISSISYAYKIEGYVYNVRTGDVVRDALIRAYNTSDVLINQTRTDNYGKYVIEVPGNTYYFIINATNYYDNTTSNYVVNGNMSINFTIQDITTGSLSVNVYDSVNNRPIEGVLVYVPDSDQQNTGGMAYTDVNGYAKVYVVGSLESVYTKINYSHEDYEGYVDYNYYNVNSGSDTYMGHIFLKGRILVQGKVTDKYNGRPVAYSKINLMRWRDDTGALYRLNYSNTYFYNTTTDVNGNYKINVPKSLINSTNEYCVNISSEGYYDLIETNNNQGYYGAYYIVSEVEGRLKVSLLFKDVLTDDVLEGVLSTVSEVDTSSYSYSPDFSYNGSSDSQGYYNVSIRSNDIYAVFASITGYDSVNLNSLSGNYTSVIYMTGDAHVNGTVVDKELDDGVNIIPINNTKVTFRGNGKEYVVYSNEQGVFNIDIPSNVSYLVSFEKEGYYEKNVSFDAHSGNNELGYINLTGDSIIKGYVKEVEQPNSEKAGSYFISRAVVSIRDNEGHKYITNSDGNGSYRINVPSGINYTVLFSKTGYMNRTYDNNGNNYTSVQGDNNIVNGELYGSTKTNFVVVDAQNNSIRIPFADIVIKSSDSDVVLYTLNSGSDGVVDINISTSSGYYIEIDKEGYKHFKSIEYSKGYNLNNALMEMTGSVHINGEVKDKATAEYIEDATVQILECDEDNVLYSVTTTNGSFSFDIDGTIKYRVRVRRDGYETIIKDNETNCYYGSFDFTGINTIFMDARFHLHLFDTYNNNPIINALVQIFEYNDTHPNNLYSFNYNVNETVYKIKVSCEGISSPSSQFNVTFVKSQCDDYQTSHNLCYFSQLTYDEAEFHRMPTGIYYYEVDGSNNGCVKKTGYYTVEDDNAGKTNIVEYDLNKTDLVVTVTSNGVPRENVRVYMENDSVIQNNALGQSLDNNTDSDGQVLFHHIIPMVYIVYVEDPVYGLKNKTIYITPASDERELIFEISDDDPPQYTSYGDNANGNVINEGDVLDIYSYWVDNLNISKVELYSNISGSEQLVDTRNMNSAKEGWANFTIDTTGHTEETIYWYLKAYDLSSNYNTTPKRNVHIRDNTIPYYSFVLPINNSVFYGKNSVEVEVLSNENVNLSVECELCSPSLYTNTTYSTNPKVQLSLQTIPVAGNKYSWNFTICDAYGNCNKSYENGDIYNFYYDPRVFKINVYDDNGEVVLDGVNVTIENSTYFAYNETDGGFVLFTELLDGEQYNITVNGSKKGYGINYTENYVFNRGEEYDVYVNVTYLTVNVTDSSYNPIVNAIVTVYNDSTGRYVLKNGEGNELTSYTRSDGTVTFTYVPEGRNYNITVDATGLGKSVNVNSTLVNVTAGQNNKKHIDPPQMKVFNVSIHVESYGTDVEDVLIRLTSYDLYRSLMVKGETHTYGNYILRVVDFNESNVSLKINDEDIVIGEGKSKVVSGTNITINDIYYTGNDDRDYVIVSASTNTINYENKTNSTGYVFFENLPSRYYEVNIYGGPRGYKNVRDVISVGYVIKKEGYTDSNGDVFINVDGRDPYYVYVYAEGYFSYDSYEEGVQFRGTYYDNYNNTGDNPVHDSVKLNLTGNVEIKGHVYDYYFVTQDPYKNITNASVILRYNQIDRYVVKTDSNGSFKMNISPYSPDSEVNHPVALDYSFIVSKEGYNDSVEVGEFEENKVYDKGDIGLNASGYFKGKLYNIITKEVIDSVLNPGSISIYRLSDNVEMYRSSYENNEYFVALNPYYNPYTISFNIQNFEDLNNYGVYNESMNLDLYLYPKDSCYLVLNFFDENGSYLRKVNVTLNNNIDFYHELYFEDNSRFMGFSRSCGLRSGSPIQYIAEVVSLNGAYENRSFVFTTNSGENQTLNFSVNSTKVEIDFINQEGYDVFINDTVRLYNNDYVFEKYVNNSNNVLFYAVPLGQYNISLENINKSVVISDKEVNVVNAGVLNVHTAQLNETEFMVILENESGAGLSDVDVELNYENVTDVNGSVLFSNVEPGNYTTWINNSKIIRMWYLPLTNESDLRVEVLGGKLSKEGNNKTFVLKSNVNESVFEVKILNGVNAVAYLRNSSSVLDSGGFDKYGFTYLYYNVSEHNESVYITVSATGYEEYVSPLYSFSSRNLTVLSVSLNRIDSGGGSGGNTPSGSGHDSSSSSSSNDVTVTYSPAPTKKEEEIKDVYGVEIMNDEIYIKNYECSSVVLNFKNTGNVELRNLSVSLQEYGFLNVYSEDSVSVIEPNETKSLTVKLCSNTFDVGVKEIYLKIKTEEKEFVKKIVINLYQNEYIKLEERYKYLYRLYESLDPDNMSEEQYMLYEEMYKALSEAYDALQRKDYEIVKQRLNDANEYYTKINELYNEKKKSKTGLWLYSVVGLLVLGMGMFFVYFRFRSSNESMVSPINPTSSGYSYTMNAPKIHSINHKHKTTWKKIIKIIKTKILRIEKDYAFFTDVYGNSYFSDIVRVVEEIPHRCHVCGSRLQNGVCPVCGTNI